MVSFCNQWKKRYLIVTSEGVMVARQSHGTQAKVREMLLFDYNFRLLYGKTTGYTKGILIKTTTRNLYLQALDHEQFLELVVSLIEAYSACSSTVLHRFNSFAPPRHSNHCDWFVDGQG